MEFDIEALKRVAMEKYHIKLDDNDPAFSLVALNAEILRQLRDQIVGEAVNKIEAAVRKLVTLEIRTHEDNFKRAITEAENRFVDRLNEYLEGEEQNLVRVFDAEIGKFRRSFRSHAEAALSPPALATAAEPLKPSFFADFGGTLNLGLLVGLVVLIAVGAFLVGHLV